MRLQTLVSPDSWKTMATEVVWGLSSPHEIPYEQLTWKPDRAALERMVVRWPAHFPAKFRGYLGDQIVQGYRRLVRVERADIPQLYDGVINFEVEIGGKRFRINIETSDYPPLNVQAYDQADLHFKQQYANEGYGERERLLPGNFMGGSSAIYRYLERLRAMRDHAPQIYEVGGRFKLFMDHRRGPLEILMDTDAFRFQGGEGKLPFVRYLQETARTKVNVSLPSTANLTFRLFDYFAIGCCIVSPPHTCRLPVPFEEGVHLVYCREDYSDLVEICADYLKRPEDRARLIRNSREFHDRYMHRDQVAGYHLAALIERFA